MRNTKGLIFIPNIKIIFLWIKQTFVTCCCCFQFIASNSKYRKKKKRWKKFYDKEKKEYKEEAREFDSLKLVIKEGDMQ